MHEGLLYYFNFGGGVIRYLLIAVCVTAFGFNSTLVIAQEVVSKKPVDITPIIFLLLTDDAETVIPETDPPVISDSLALGQSLGPTQYLVSPNTNFRLVLQGDGNVVLRNWLTRESLWSSGSQQENGTELLLQADGNLVLKTSTGEMVWSSDTANQGVIEARLLDSGYLVLRDAQNTVVWTTQENVDEPDDTIKPLISLIGNANISLLQGSAFNDPGATANDNVDGDISQLVTVTGSVNTSVIGNYTLSYNVSDAAGNAADTVSRVVEITPPPAPLRNSLAPSDELVLDERLTSSNESYELVMQSDGNLVLYQVSNNNVLWASETNGSAASKVRLQGDGNFVMRTATGSSVWSTGTGGQGGVLLVLRDDGNLVLLNSEGVVVWSTEPVPYVVFLSPSDGLAAVEGSTINVSADAFDDDGIASVQLLVDGSLNSTDTTAPFSFSLSNLAVGSHTLQLRSIDNVNTQLNSEQITVNITASEPTQDTISLPIEVLGAAGTTRSINFNLNDISNVSHVYLECNVCGYHELDLDKDPSLIKATMTVNGGNAIALKHFTENEVVYGNGSITILGGAAHYGGIGGGFRTVKMMVPVSNLQVGNNQVSFEFLDAIPPSIGFRIVDFNVLTNGSINNKVLAPERFIQDNPENWVPPLSSASDIEAGRQLWKQRNHLYDPWVDRLDGQAGNAGPMTGNIKASCADCHAADGRDLKYFNFSNQSIVERSKFHSLSEQQGQKIASYIRQLDIPVVSQARPWNPTYQPGPGLDNKPVYEWAAGAGMSAVLDDDADMAPYLFPNGTSLSNVRAVVDRYSTLNMRELPINIPMPEWNQWLPIIHPDDAFDITDPAVTSDQFGNDVGQPYYKELYDIALNNPTPSRVGRITIFIKRWLGKGLSCQTNGVGRGEPLRGLNGDVLSEVIIDLNTADPVDVTQANCNERRDSPGMLVYEIAKRGLTAWSSVKLWEITHGLNLEEESLNMTTPVCSDGRCIDASEPRGWEIDGRNVFDRPPHFVGTASGRRFFSQNQMLGILESNSWYHLNLVLNSGYRQAMPSHFAYLYSHVQLLQFESQVDQGFRYWATLIKQRQLQTNGEYGIENGLDLRTAEPYVYYGSARDNTRTETHSNVGQVLWARLATALIDDLVADASNASDADWANASGNYSVQPKMSTNFSPCGSLCRFDIGPYQGRNTYRVIPKLREIGVEENTLINLINWAEATWPHGPWDDVK